MELRNFQIITKEKKHKYRWFKLIERDNEVEIVYISKEGECFPFIGENFYQALLRIREFFESRGEIIVCDGTVENVFPSPMSLSMGSGRFAYKLTMGQSAKNVDLVDIFDNNLVNFKHVTILDQTKFYEDWLESL